MYVTPNSLTETPQQLRHYIKIINTDLLSSPSAFHFPHCSQLVLLKLRSDPVPPLIKILEGPPLSLINPLSWVLLAFPASVASLTPPEVPPNSWLKPGSFFKLTRLLLLWVYIPPLPSPFFLLPLLHFTWLFLLMLQFSACSYH